MRGPTPPWGAPSGGSPVGSTGGRATTPPRQAAGASRRARHRVGQRGCSTATRLVYVWVLALGLAAVSPSQAAPPCAPWPGEPTPLPNASQDSPAGMRWANLRVAELALLAWDLEQGAPADAHAIWLHVACLDPMSQVAEAGIARTRPVRVHRPAVVIRAGAAPRVGDGDLLKAFSMLDEAIVVQPAPAPAPPRAPEPPADPLARVRSRVVGLIGTGEGDLREARFEQALASLDSARTLLDGQGASAEARRLRSRLEVAAASAELALGREAAARASFARALAADPALELDPMTTSPKIRRFFETVREAEQ